MQPQPSYPPQVAHYGDPGKRLFDNRVEIFIKECGDTPEQAREAVLLAWDIIVAGYGPKNLQREAQEQQRT